MGLVLNNNVSSLTAQHNLLATNANLSRSLERLSTGLKVNRGADGPAALVISEKQRAQIAGMKQAIDNTNKAIKAHRLLSPPERLFPVTTDRLGRLCSLRYYRRHAGKICPLPSHTAEVRAYPVAPPAEAGDNLRSIPSSEPRKSTRS
jgi:hypothetical protein